MFDNCFQKESCSRREFVTAAGVLVAGGLVSCSKNDGNTQTNLPKMIFTPLNQTVDPIIMRILIGKSREKTGIKLDKAQVVRTALGWNTSNDTKLLLYKKSDQTIFCDERGPHRISIGGKTKRFTGHISLHAREEISNCAFDVVAHVPIEAYVPGVIAGELFSHWHPNTFAAQAVAARSYAIAQHHLRKTTSHFDLSDGPTSQVFLGDVTLDVAHRAVLETRGVVLACNDRVIPSYYSACCGGLAATANDAIGESSMHNIVPLQGRSGEDVCTVLDVHKWTIERPHRNFKRRLAKWTVTTNNKSFRGLRSITSIVPIQTNPHGRPTKLKIVERRNKSWTIDANHLVRAANASFSSLPNPTPRVWSSNLTASRLGANIEISGTGLGHGVGLCQYGAQVLAGKGKSWESILSWYYPDVTFGTIKV